ncbi:diguanylate cyclase [Aestuariibius insulae]|uniref:diguanylate cyclase n=1 Tax=Aestuariibius insulae TaxID=2058287 RepID=UPI00345EF65A
MSGKILIIDDVATNRIVLKVKLTASQYDIISCLNCNEARRSVRSSRPDLIVIDLATQGQAGIEFLTDIKQMPEISDIPVIGLTDEDQPDRKLAALRCGADEVLTKPADDILLLARIRSLLRARDTSSELRLRDDTKRALGFAEPAASFQRQAKVALAADVPAIAQMWEDAIRRDCSAVEAVSVQPDKVFMVPDVDLFLIDATQDDEKKILALIADLHSRPETRLAAILLVIQGDSADFAAMALDLGASDILMDGFSSAELVLRIEAQAKRKARQDQFRAGLRNGLRAAVTDPLTGLHNRRYALPHLAGLDERARATGRDYAVMLLDIDHFKMVNDEHGHGVGDKVLVEIARRLEENTRGVDLLARIGGEEFMIAMPGTTEAQARQTAERLRALIEDTPIQIDGEAGVTVTTSIGVALQGMAVCPGVSVEAIVERADAALYQSKERGRNMVTMSEVAA